VTLLVEIHRTVWEEEGRTPSTAKTMKLVDQLSVEEPATLSASL
jgi:hypothetical protein